MTTHSASTARIQQTDDAALWKATCPCGWSTNPTFITRSAAKSAAEDHCRNRMWGVPDDYVSEVIDTLNESPSVDTLSLTFSPGPLPGEVLIQRGDNPFRLLVHSEMDVENLTTLVSTFDTLYW